MTRALITGVTGQDGSYLAEFLLAKGYEVHGMLRRSSVGNTQRIDHLSGKIILHTGDMADAQSIRLVIDNASPDEIYNLAAQSDVPSSFKAPAHTLDVVAGGALRIFEAARGLRVKIYQASSSEMFGSSPPPQSETTRFLPQNPYAVAKVAAHHYARLYREAYGMFISCGIAFNHESPRRGEEFVTRKICKAAASIAAGKQHKLYLGDIDTYRDWGFAGDYVEAMWLMLQAGRPDDYVIATGASFSVREFVDLAFSVAGLDWWRHVDISGGLMRPLETRLLKGDPTKIMAIGWAPKVGFLDLVEMMVKAEMA